MAVARFDAGERRLARREIDGTANLSEIVAERGDHAVAARGLQALGKAAMDRAAEFLAAARLRGDPAIERADLITKRAERVLERDRVDGRQLAAAAAVDCPLALGNLLDRGLKAADLLPPCIHRRFRRAVAPGDLLGDGGEAAFDRAEALALALGRASRFLPVGLGGGLAHAAPDRVAAGSAFDRVNLPAQFLDERRQRRDSFRAAADGRTRRGLQTRRIDGGCRSPLIAGSTARSHHIWPLDAACGIVPLVPSRGVPAPASDSLAAVSFR